MRRTLYFLTSRQRRERPSLGICVLPWKAKSDLQDEERSKYTPVCGVQFSAMGNHLPFYSSSPDGAVSLGSIVYSHSFVGTTLVLYVLIIASPSYVRLYP